MRSLKSSITFLSLFYGLDIIIQSRNKKDHICIQICANRDDTQKLKMEKLSKLP